MMCAFEANGSAMPLFEADEDQNGSLVIINLPGQTHKKELKNGKS
jgi:hypothetical protein